MLRLSIVVSALTFVSTVGFATVAGAQAAPSDTATVTFEGTVPASCSFADPTPGIVAVYPDQLTTLSSNAPGGTFAIVQVQCTAPGTVSVESIASDNSTNTETEPFVFLNGTGPNQPRPIPAGLTSLRVDLDATTTNGQPLPAGNYFYDVQLTAAPR